MKKTIGICAAIILAISVVGCSRQPDPTESFPSPSPSAIIETDEPDCDPGDILERDTDCGFKKPATVKTAVPKPTPNKTGTSRTRRP